METNTLKEKENSILINSDFKFKENDLRSYEENLKWESALISEALHDTRKRKFFAINVSIILFPGLIGGILAIASYLEKVGVDQDEKVGYYWVTIVAISIFIGIANMISIKYIAAYKAQANLFIRQLNCLRQARDSVTYNRIEGKFPKDLKFLLDKNTTYYKIFGRHRKLYIGNEELRDRLVGSFSESADKSLIGFLFITSSTLISAPFIYLAAVSFKKWDLLKDFHFYPLDSEISLIFLNMFFVVLAVLLLMLGHWENFTRLRTGDAITDISEDITGRDEEGIIHSIKYFGTDFLALAVLSALSFYWICLPSYIEINKFLKYFMLILFALFQVIFVISMFRQESMSKQNKNNNVEQKKYKALFELKRTDYVAMVLVILLAVYWFYLGWNTGITVFKIVMLFLSILSAFLILVCVKKVFFDSLNRIHKSLVYKIEFSAFNVPPRPEETSSNAVDTNLSMRF